MRPKICVLIPVYNHASTLRGVAEDALAHIPDVMVIDDGSADNPLPRLSGLPVRTMRLAANKGKGRALRAGALEAAKAGFTHIITMDADGQHLGRDLPAFIEAVRQSPGAIIIGARDFSVPNVPASSKFGRKFSGFWMFLQSGTAVSDMQSGFRAYPLAALAALDCRCSGYAFEIEVLVKAAWAGFALREIPIKAWYPPKAERISHFKAFKDNLKISLLNTRLTIRALTPLPFKRQALKVEGGLSLFRPRKAISLLAERSSPHLLGKSAAWSILISSIPIFGLNTIMLLFAINWRRLDRLCALLLAPAAWLPFIPGLSALAGHRLIYGSWLTELNLQTLGREAGYRLLDWLAGSLVVAPVLAAAAYAAVYSLARAVMKKG